MPHHRHHDQHRTALLVLLLAVLLGACSQTATPGPATSTVAATSQPSPAAPPPPVTPTPSPVPGAPAIDRQLPPRPAPTATPLSRAGLPLRLKIPALGIDAAIEEVGLTPEGAMDVPREYDNTAWYTLGPRPGEPGNAVIAGHVDSQTGPAVFWELRALTPGDEILVVGDDGVERLFVVTALEVYPRQEAPLRRIFGPATGTGLNLITCDGVFDQQRQEYDQNLVVYAEYAP